MNESPPKLPPGKQYSHIVQSKLFTPTANQINSKWVPVVKEKVEPVWNSIIRVDVPDIPAPIIHTTDKKMQAVKSKLYAPTAASVHCRYDPPEISENSRFDSPAKGKSPEKGGRSQSENAVLKGNSPQRPISASLLRTTTATVLGQWVKPVVPEPKKVEHRRLIESPPPISYKNVSSKLHVATTASIQSRYTGPQFSGLPPHASITRETIIPLQQLSQIVNNSIPKTGGVAPVPPHSPTHAYNGHNGHHTPAVPHYEDYSTTTHSSHKTSSVSAPFAAANPKPFKHRSSIPFTPTPDKDIWSSQITPPRSTNHSSSRVPARRNSSESAEHLFSYNPESPPQTPVAQSHQAQLHAQEIAAAYAHHEEDTARLPASLLKTTAATIHGHYQKPAPEPPSRQEVLYLMHANKHQHGHDNESPSTLLKATAASIHGHYKKPDPEIVIHPYDVAPVVSRRSSVTSVVGSPKKPAQSLSSSPSSPVPPRELLAVTPPAPASPTSSTSASIQKPTSVVEEVAVLLPPTPPTDMSPSTDLSSASVSSELDGHHNVNEFTNGTMEEVVQEDK